MAPITVSGPSGDFVIREERRGVPARTTLLLGGAFDLWKRMRRRLRGDRSWLVVVNRRDRDPLGPAVYVEVVPTRREVDVAAARIARLVQAGALPADDLRDA